MQVKAFTEGFTLSTPLFFPETIFYWRNLYARLPAWIN